LPEGIFVRVTELISGASSSKTSQQIITLHSVITQNPVILRKTWFETFKIKIIIIYLKMTLNRSFCSL